MLILESYMCPHVGPQSKILRKQQTNSEYIPTDLIVLSIILCHSASMQSDSDWFECYYFVMRVYDLKAQTIMMDTAMESLHLCMKLFCCSSGASDLRSLSYSTEEGKTTCTWSQMQPNCSL